MDSGLVDRLEALHRQHAHQQVVALIDSQQLPTAEDYQSRIFLARAYHHLGHHKKSLEQLMAVEHGGASDPYWHFLVGSAHLHLENYDTAEMHARKAVAMDNANKEYTGLLEATIYGLTGLDTLCALESLHMYTDEEEAVIEAFVEATFGTYDAVFHELVSTDVHLDIFIIDPTPAHPYYKLITCGAGAYATPGATEDPDAEQGRAEYIIYLPGDWDLQSHRDADYWPVRCLKALGRLGLEKHMCSGSTISGLIPFAEGVPFTSVLLTEPQGIFQPYTAARLPGGDSIHFYQVQPLYPKEQQLQSEKGTDALLARWAASRISPVVDIHRVDVG